MAAVTTATAATLISNIWAENIEQAANDILGVTKMITDTGDRYFGPGGGNIFFPNVGNIAATAYGAGTTTLTFTANTEGTTTVNPTVVYTAVEIYEDVLNTTIVDAVKQYTPILRAGLDQNIDETILGQHANTVTTVGTSSAGYNFLEADFLSGLAQLHANGKDKVVAGSIYGIYHPLQYDNMMAISNIVSASVRGETNGPAKTGVIGLSNGTNIFFTSNVQLLTTNMCNLLIVPKWLILARKNRPKVEMERTNLATRVIASTMYGVAVQWTNCGVRHITQSLESSSANQRGGPSVPPHGGSMAPKFDLDANAGEVTKPEYFEHPEEGWLSFEPNTLQISPKRDGQKPISHPIGLYGKFFGTKQSKVPTCSEPGHGNIGCSKWAGCPMKKFPWVGPGNVIMRKRGSVNASPCYDYFEATVGGRAVSQLHHGMDGWKLDTTRTTIDVLGRTGAIEKGKLDVESSRQAVLASKPALWQMEVGGLLPPWWPLMKKKGLPLPKSAEHYPELAEDESEEEVRTKSRGRRSSRSA